MKQERATKGLSLDGKLMLLAVAPVTSALLVVLIAAELLFPRVLGELAQDPKNPSEERILEEELNDTLSDLRRILLSVGSGALLASLVAAATFSRKLRNRLRRLGQIAAQIEQEDLSARVNDSTQDQVGQVGHALDRMAASVQEAQVRVASAERLAAIGQLGASVAHELRNPMGAIVTSLALIDEKLARKDTAIEKHLAKIKRNTDDANRIISDLLTYARVKEPQKKNLSVIDLFDAALLVSPTPTGVQIKRTNEEKWPRIFADKDQLIQVVSNLLTNAYQALDDHGVIQLSASTEKEHDTLSVEDNGPGIPEEKRKLIFEPLVTSKAKGTGLGLALCDAIVRGHQGEIEATASSLGGAKFLVRLPK
jgi:signal transduction histidine kinase